MGVIALAASKPGMEQRLGVSFDEIPSARLRSYAEVELPKHLGITKVRPQSAKHTPSLSTPRRLRPLPMSAQAPKPEEPVSAAWMDGLVDSKYLKKGQTPRALLFLDSGAFSVWSRGADITLDNYSEFLGQAKDYIDYAFNLDILPGAPGKPASRAEGEATAEAGMQNWRELRKRGFETIHTYHEGEPIEQLLRIRDESLETMKDPFMALSPLATSGRALRWFTECWKNLVDSDGKPLLKVHGLGVLEYEGTTSFPWASVDGTTWLNGSIYGTVCDWVRDQSGKDVLRQIVVTRGLKDGRNGWLSRPLLEQQSLAERVFKCSVAEVLQLSSLDWRSRIDAFNLRSYKRLENLMPERFNAGPQPLRLV